MKTRQQNRNNKRTEIERVAFGWLRECFMPEEISINQSILRFDVILQHDWPIEQCLLHMAGKRRFHVLIFSSIG